MALVHHTAMLPQRTFVPHTAMLPPRALLLVKSSVTSPVLGLRSHTGESAGPVKVSVLLDAAVMFSDPAPIVNRSKFSSKLWPVSRFVRTATISASRSVPRRRPTSRGRERPFSRRTHPCAGSGPVESVGTHPRHPALLWRGPAGGVPPVRTLAYRQGARPHRGSAA